jgi:glutamate racemase
MQHPAAPANRLPQALAVAPRVGLFDSGIGGLSVLAAVRRALPAAHCIYLADGRHTPWGQRPPAWVLARCRQLAGWLIDEAGADLVLVACNTATTQAIAALRRQWPRTPFVGVEPGIKPATAASRNRRVAVLATPGTLASPRLRHLVQAHGADAQVLSLPCPGLALAIEQADGRAGEPATVLQAQLDDIAQRLQQAAVDTVVLGCTHYPLVAGELKARLGPQVRLIDTAEAVARRVSSLLPPGHATDAPGGLRLLSTGDATALQRAARHWLALQVVAEPMALPEPLPDLPGG